MGVDHNEAKRRRKVDQPKYATKQPIAAIEKRVVDSEAFCALSPSAVVVLLVLARNLAKGMNGHIFVSKQDAARHGVAKKTFYRALIELQTHGFIFPTMRGGHGKCGTYALTWLSLSKDTTNLHVENFKPCAWRDLIPAPKKKRGVKMSPRSSQKYPQPINLVVKNSPSLVVKNSPLECTYQYTHCAGVGVGVDLDRDLEIDIEVSARQKPGIRG